MKRNDELVTTSFDIGDSGFSNGVNVEITKYGTIKKRKGYNTFGEMVDVLWNINKSMKKNNFGSIQYTVMLPLKGIKPIYKKTLKKGKS